MAKCEILRSAKCSPFIQKQTPGTPVQEQKQSQGYKVNSLFKAHLFITASCKTCRASRHYIKATIQRIN